MQLTDEQFDALITQAMDELPPEYIKNLHNVVVTFADTPSPEQAREAQNAPRPLAAGAI